MPDPSTSREHKRFLDTAARAALRAAGDVEPNPMVGAVIVRDGRVIGIGHHRRFGGPHAEAEALADCARRGESPAGATMYVTLEPCNHHGKQPPCAAAVIAARIARIVCARPDPNPVSTGGAAALRAAGIDVEFTSASELAVRLSDPFVKRTATGLPYVIAKWAQTIDGRIATRTGESQWISSEPSRRMVHRLRARVDAILTGIGTVKADDPLLTARGVTRVRRTARRVVIDPLLEIPPESGLVRSASQAPLTVACTEEAAESAAAARLAARGVEVLPLPGPADDLDLSRLLRHLASAHDATNILVEAGAGTLGGLLRADLIDEALVFIAPILMADEAALPAAIGKPTPALADAERFRLLRAKALGPDVVLRYGRKPGVTGDPTRAGGRA